MPKKFPALAAAAVAFLALAGTDGVQAQTCTEYTNSVSESFDSGALLDLANSSVKFWYSDASNPRSLMTLNRLGANFAISNPSYVPAWVNALTTNDFDLDGWPDYIASSSSFSNVLAFVKNQGGSGQVGKFEITYWIDGSTGNSSGWPTGGVAGAPIDGEGHNAITSGDYDGDGDIDFLTIVSTTAGGNAIKRAWLYENRLITGGINTGVLNFVKTDLTAAWSPTVKGIAWSATCLVSVDLDNDGDIDIVVGNYEGKIFKATNTASGVMNIHTFDLEATPIVDTGFSYRGVNTISIAQFDGTPGLDIIAGSVSEAPLRFYQGDGLGHFVYLADFTDPDGGLNDNMYDGAATVSLVADFDQDGDQDLIIGTDNWNYGGTGYGGKAYYFNNDGNANFTVTLIFNGPSKSPAVADFDIGAVLDFDNDGDLDFFIADGNDSEYYYIFVNSIADVYNLTGIGTSLNLTPTLPGNQYAITKVRFAAIHQSVIGGSSSGLSVTYYVSNDNGQSWEYYASYSGSGIVNISNEDWHDFHSFGSKLRWKAVLQATDDGIAAFPSASYETPAVDRLVLEYIYVERREYSRSSAAAAAIISGTRRKLIISASFMFPGFDGQLRAYDVTDIALTGSGGSTVRTITTSDPLSPTGRNVVTGGSILWDAGALLAARDQSTRTIYAAFKSRSWDPLSRIDFTEANANTLKSILADPDSDTAGLIRFVRGAGRTWKLGDVLHSSPVLLGAPSGDEVALGTSYSAFVAAHADRTPVVFIGANDGMLHCFDLTTGTELWGFIPYNLLPKLKNMSEKDPFGTRLYTHDYFVDAVPNVADAYVNGAWRTILMCGQGAGYGSSAAGGLNYYFALDVTDPTDPQVMWEAYDPYTMGETWSTPVFGQVRVGTTNYWVAFTGSGYDNNTARVLGNYFYVIRLDNGAILKKTAISANVNTSLSSKCPHPYPDIQAVVTASPSALDVNRDGRTDYVYFADLDGRVYRGPYTSTNSNQWTPTAIYTDENFYPIITKPALYPDPSTGGLPVMVLFGTGGDDAAPADRTYAFICLSDKGNKASLEWYLGDPDYLDLDEARKVGIMGVGEKVWSDPVISDRIVYFSALLGSIENVNPCLNLGQTGRLYARYVEAVAGGVLGASSLKNATGGAVESLQLASKARRAVTVGELQAGGGADSKKEVYIQEYDSTIERLEHPVSSLLRVVTWREINKIIR